MFIGQLKLVLCYKISFSLILAVAFACNQTTPVKTAEKQLVQSKNETDKDTSHSFFGYRGLAQYTYPKKWIADPNKYGHLTQQGEKEFEKLTAFYDSLNSLPPIDYPVFNQPQKLDLNGRLEKDKVNKHERLHKKNCIARFNNIGVYECYYFYSKYVDANGYTNQGSLLLLHPTTKESKLIPVYLEASGEQHIMYRFFYMAKNNIRLFDAYYYDDGCSIYDVYEIGIEKNESIRVTKKDKTS